MADELDKREVRTLDVLERVARALRDRGLETAIIGAVAASVHNYARATNDIDLASDVPLKTLHDIKEELEGEKFEVTLNEPDAQDHLGGVLTVSGDDFDAIQIVNYLNPYKASGGTRLGKEAIESATDQKIRSVPVVDLAHLVALKLYSGGGKGRNDVSELLERNPDADIAAILKLCTRHRLDGPLRTILEDLGRLVPER